MVTGKKGWFKRIDNESSSVKRKITLTDEVALDVSGKAFDKIESTARKAVARDLSKAISIPNGSVHR